MTAPVSVKRLAPLAKLPACGSPDAAGADLHALTDGPVTIAPYLTAQFQPAEELETTQRGSGGVGPAGNRYKKASTP